MQAWHMSIDISGINEVINQMKMADEDIASACGIALGAMRAPFIKEISKLTCERYNISSKTINRKLAAKVLANSETLEIYISGRPLNLMSFEGTTPAIPQKIVRDTSLPKRHININGKFITTHPLKPYNVSVEIIKGRRKTLSHTNTSFPFVMKTGAGDAIKMPYFIARSPKGRAKGVKGVTTLSIPQMFSNEENEAKIREKGKEIFLKAFEQAMKRINAANNILKE